MNLNLDNVLTKCSLTPIELSKKLISEKKIKQKKKISIYQELFIDGHILCISSL